MSDRPVEFESVESVPSSVLGRDLNTIWSGLKDPLLVVGSSSNVVGEGCMSIDEPHTTYVETLLRLKYYDKSVRRLEPSALPRTEDSAEKLLRDFSLIVIGGPARNPVAGYILDRWNTDISFIVPDQGENELLLGGERHGCDRNDGGSVTEDIGVTIRRENPFSPEFQCVLLAGTRYLGTRGVCMASISAEMARQICDWLQNSRTPLTWLDRARLVVRTVEQRRNEYGPEYTIWTEQPFRSKPIQNPSLVLAHFKQVQRSILDICQGFTLKEVREARASVGQVRRAQIYFLAAWVSFLYVSSLSLCFWRVPKARALSILFFALSVAVALLGNLYHTLRGRTPVLPTSVCLVSLFGCFAVGLVALLTILFG